MLDKKNLIEKVKVPQGDLKFKLAKEVKVNSEDNSIQLPIEIEGEESLLPSVISTISLSLKDLKFWVSYEEFPSEDLITYQKGAEFSLKKIKNAQFIFDEDENNRRYSILQLSAEELSKNIKSEDWKDIFGEGAEEEIESWETAGFVNPYQAFLARENGFDPKWFDGRKKGVFSPDPSGLGKKYKSWEINISKLIEEEWEANFPDKGERAKWLKWVDENKQEDRFIKGRRRSVYILKKVAGNGYEPTEVSNSKDRVSYNGWKADTWKAPMIREYHPVWKLINGNKLKNNGRWNSILTGTDERKPLTHRINGFILEIKDDLNTAKERIKKVKDIAEREVAILKTSKGGEWNESIIPQTGREQFFHHEVVRTGEEGNLEVLHQVLTSI